MSAITFIEALRELFGPQEASAVLAALRSDKLVWRTLESEGFTGRALSALSDNMRLWNPANLALISLDEEKLIGKLAGEPMPSLESSLRQRAIRLYETLRRKDQPPATLAEAGLVALALRERRRLTGSWNGLVEELVAKQGNSSARIWSTALACLAGMVPDVARLLNAILSSGKSAGVVDWAVHLLLCTPEVPSSLIDQAVEALSELPAQVQIDFLKSANAQGRTELVAKTAGIILAQHPAIHYGAVRFDLDKADSQILANRSAALCELGALYELTGDMTQCKSNLRAAADILDYWQTSLRMSISQGSEELGDLARRISGLRSVSPKLMGAFGKIALERQSLDVDLKEIVDPTQDPSLMAAKFVQAFNRGEVNAAEGLALQAVDAFLDRARNNELIPGALEFIRSLLALDLEREALLCCEAALELRPVDDQLILMTSKLMANRGAVEGARLYAGLASALHPESIELKRYLAEMCEEAGHWNEAFEQRQQVVKLSAAPELADLTSFIRAALKSERVEAATQASYDLLDAHPEMGEAHGWLGKALAMQARWEDAINHLSRATLLEPEQAQWWLDLAAVYKDCGKRNQEVETLKAAVIAAPNSGEAQYAIAQNLRENGLAAEALPYLRQAVKLQSSNLIFSLAYAQVLRELSYLTEARGELENKRKKWTANPELAYEFAQVAQQMDDWDAALPAYEMAAHTEKAPTMWRVQYAEALLRNQCDFTDEAKTLRVAQAYDILERVSAEKPDDTKIQYLFAEALRKRGEAARAIVVYRQLADSLTAEQAGLGVCVNRGMGLAALALGQTELALASLKEAQQAQPENVSLLHDLAGAYLTSRLPRDASQMAEAALQLSPHDPTNLVWFKNIMVELGDTKRAKEALQRVIGLEPEQIGHRLQMARLEVESGDLDAARVILDELSDMPVDSEDLQDTAYLYLRLQDSNAALSCLERAMKMPGNKSADMLFELARLYEQAEKYGDAMEVVQQLVGTGQTDTEALLLQADLLARMGRYDAAQSVLDILGATTDETKPAPQMPILERSVKWYLSNGDLPQALEQAEKALEMDPAHLELRKLAVQAAMEMLLDDKAIELAEAVTEEHLLADDTGNGFDILCKRIDLAMEAGNLDQAEKLLDAGLPKWGDRPALQELLSRFKAISGYLLGTVSTSDEPSKEELTLETGKSALAMGLWKTGLSLLEKLAQALTNNPKAAFELARALVLCAEAFRLYRELNIESHAPSADSLSDERHQQFEQAMEKAARFGSTARLQRWLARGRAAFNPTSQTLKELAAVAVSPDEYAALASGLRMIGSPQAALHALSRFDQSPECLLQRILCGLVVDVADVDATIRKLLAGWPNNPVYQLAVATIFLKKGEKAKAKGLVEEALAAWPKEADWHAQAAALAADGEDIQTELVHWEAACEIAPARPDFSRALGKSYMKNEQFEEALKVFTDAIQVDPDSVEGWVGLAKAQYEVDKLADAMVSAQRASELEGDGVDGILMMGLVAFKVGHLDQAREYAWTAVRRDPNHPEAVLALDKILSAQGRTEEALMVIENALPNLEPDARVLYERARLMYNLKGAATALPALQHLAREFPDHSEGLALLAHAQADCGDEKGAERSAFKSLRLNPIQPELSMLLGRLQRKTGQLDQAVHLLSESIRIDPANVEYYLELGQAYLERREDVMALRTFQQATRIAPKDPRAYCQAALLMRDSKDYPGAESMLQQAAKLAPEDVQIRRQLVGVMTLNLIHKTQEAGSAL